VLLVVAIVVAVALLAPGSGDDGGGGDGATAAPRAASTTTTRAAGRPSTTTTVTAAPVATATPPTTRAPATPVTTVATVPVDRGGAVATLDAGSCSWDADTGDLLASGTVTNRSGELTAVEITVSWLGPDGDEIDSGSDVQTLAQGESAPWSASSTWYSPDDPDAPPPALHCELSLS
jgi:hypothetical protein